MNDQYAAPNSDLLDPALANTEENYTYLGFWIRVVASILDNIWMFFVLLAVMMVLSAVGLVELSVESTSALEIILQVLIPFSLIMFLWNRYASTPGKMLFKGKILDAKTFQPAPPGRLFLRYIGYIVSTLPFFLGFLWVAFDSRKQGFHDKIAGTVVVREE